MLTSTSTRPTDVPVMSIAPVTLRLVSSASGMPSVDGKSMNADWSASPPRPTTESTMIPQPSPPSVPVVVARCGLSLLVPQPSRRT